MKQLYQTVTTAEMAITPATASMDNSLRLMDNIDEPFTLQNEERKNFLNRPIQYVSAMSLMVCLQGVTKVNIGCIPARCAPMIRYFLRVASYVR